ncbi:MAG: bifunctional ornithine acetyltransferase/N-acetylglutamate synthase, partial [Acidobacteria bacterium]|nr:bifunctional ornithine acetyltransferase/N-acetylglutamate synthase [Acidobacteriota bacterium]
MSKWKPVDGNIATPAGFRAAATSAGFKRGLDALDLALIFSEVTGTRAAAVFTTNRVVGAPIVLGREHLRRSRGRLRAIIVNSGN